MVGKRQRKSPHRISGLLVEVVVDPTDSQIPRLTVRVKHLAGSKTLRHATLRAVVR